MAQTSSTATNGIFAYRHKYQSVSWRYVIEDVLNVARGYMASAHSSEPNVAFILANDAMIRLRDSGDCYQMYFTKFEILRYNVGFVIASDGVPHYTGVNTEYKMYWTEKKWTITGTAGEVVPAFDPIPTQAQTVDLFIQGLLAADISPLGGAAVSAFAVNDRTQKRLEAKDYLDDYVGVLRPDKNLDGLADV